VHRLSASGDSDGRAKRDLVEFIGKSGGIGIEEVRLDFNGESSESESEVIGRGQSQGFSSQRRHKGTAEDYKDEESHRSVKKPQPVTP
jgi:hypothetical protein